MKQSQHKAILYSIVIGALNEEAYIEKTLLALEVYLKKQNIWQETEVVIVVPPGDDDTYGLVSRILQKNTFNFHKVIRPVKRVGKGRDIRLGMLASRGKYACFMDADGATPLKYLGKLFSTLRTGKADVVFGQRRIWSMHNRLLRNMSSGFSNVATRLLAGLGIKDSQCGFKGFTREAITTTFEPLETTKWAFDIEVYVRAKNNNLRVSWLPVTDWQDPKTDAEGLGGERQLKAMIATMKDLTVIAVRRVSGHYLPPNKRVVRTGVLKSILLGVIWYTLLHLVFLGGFGVVGTDQPNVSPVRPGVVQAVDTFDSPFYKEIAEYGYKGTGSIKHLAFYPLYPALLRIGQVLTLHSLDIRTVAFLLNGFFVAATAGILYLIGSRLKIPRPIFVVLAWLLFPWAMFLGAMYTEALFCFLVASAVLLLLKKNWYGAAIIACLASFSRLPGTLVGVLVVFEFLRQVALPAFSHTKTKEHGLGRIFITAIFLSAISFSGLICWLGYQWVAFGSPFAFQEAYRTLWSYQVFSPNIIAPLTESTRIAFNGLLHKNIEAELFEVGAWMFAFVIGILAMISRLKIPKGWYLFIVLNLVLVLLNSNTVSVNRYILPIMILYPMFIMLAYKLPSWLRNITIYGFFVSCLLVQILMAIRLVNFAWVG
jgi:dolichyl-phosphate beta-glucosyltransferase